VFKNAARIGGNVPSRAAVDDAENRARMLKNSSIVGFVKEPAGGPMIARSILWMLTELVTPSCDMTG
jgi:hypothetical protein